MPGSCDEEYFPSVAKILIVFFFLMLIILAIAIFLLWTPLFEAGSSQLAVAGCILFFVAIIHVIGIALAFVFVPTKGQVAEGVACQRYKRVPGWAVVGS